MTILIVHPEALVSAAVRQSYGADAITASTADEALAIARAHMPDLDLVLLDLDLDGADGIALCRRLSSLLPAVPIVASSQDRDESVVSRAFDAGAQDFITKPFRIAELSARIRVALQLREERRKQALREHRLVHWAKQLEKAKRRLESTICVDALTGVANRRHFDNLLRAECRRAARDETTLSLVIVDLDDFHAYNERYGHVGGDACLSRVAGAMAHALRRASDVIARYGGEELVAVLPHTDVAGACIVAERLRRCVESLAIPHDASRCSRFVTISAGVASARRSGVAGPEVLVAAADAALFRAKAAGKNRCRADGIDAEQVKVTRRPWPTCPVAVLDPALSDRVPHLLEAMKADVRNAVVAAADGDLLLAQVVAQQARRVGGEYGFSELLGLGGQLDAAVRATEEPNALASLDRLAWYLEHVQVVYRTPALRAV